MSAIPIDHPMSSANRGEKRRRSESEEEDEDCMLISAEEFSRSSPVPPAAAVAANRADITAALSIQTPKSSPPPPSEPISPVIPTPEQVKAVGKARKKFQDALQKALQCSEKAAPKGRFATGNQTDKEVDDAFKLEVNGYGSVSLPLTAKTSQSLIALAKPSPFGNKEATVYDKNVRNSWQLDPSQLQLSEEWLRKLHAHIFAQVNEELALRMTHPEELELHLYKMLLYECGGHFAKHRDTEKESNMFGTFVLVLPSDFAGGSLFVEQDKWLKTYFNADTIRRTGRSEWAAFFTDCEHELKPVTDGYRVALSFNMVRKASRTAVPNSVEPVLLGNIVKLLDHWKKTDCQALGIMLRHQYSTAFIKDDAPTSLKGADVDTLALVQAAISQLTSAKSGDNSSAAPSRSVPAVALQLCNIKVSESGWFDGGEENEEDRRTESRNIEAQGFTPQSYLDTMLGAKGQVSLAYLVLPTGEDESELFEEDVEYTGNEGTNFERFYHRTAIVLVDAENPWKFLRGERFSRTTVIFTEAVDAIGNQLSAFNSSSVGQIIAATSDSSSPISQTADFACSLWKRLQKHCDDNEKLHLRLAPSLRSPSFSRGEGNAINLLQFADGLLRLRSHCLQALDDTVHRVESLLKDLLDTKHWFRKAESFGFGLSRTTEPLALGAPVAKFLARLSKWNENLVTRWLHARQMETSDKVHFITQVAQLTKIHPSLLGDDIELPVNIIIEMVLGLFVQQLRQFPQENNKTGSPIVAAAAAVPAANEVTAISAVELASHMPSVEELARGQSPDTLLKHILFLVALSLNELNSALSVFVQAMESKNPPIEFIRTTLHKAVLELNKNVQGSTPIQKLLAYTVLRLDQVIRTTSIPPAASYWIYSEKESKPSCNCSLCYEVVRYLQSNQCVHSFRGMEKIRRHISGRWCGYRSRSQLLEETLRTGSPHTLVMCKPKSNVEAVHEQCGADIELLTLLYRECGENPFVSTARTPSFPYDVSEMLELITQLQAERITAFRNFSSVRPAKQSKW